MREGGVGAAKGMGNLQSLDLRISWCLKSLCYRLIIDYLLAIPHPRTGFPQDVSVGESKGGLATGLLAQSHARAKEFVSNNVAHFNGSCHSVLIFFVVNLTNPMVFNFW